MGLDTTHDAWHGPYSSFNRFRYWLAAQIGVNLNDYAGYKESGTKELETINHPIMPLLNHSDCDGELTPDQCRSIAKGIKEILKTAKPEDRVNPFGHFSEAETFMKGCIRAANKKENIGFH